MLNRTDKNSEHIVGTNSSAPDDDSVDLVELIKIIFANRVILLIFAILGIFGGSLVACYLRDVYSSNAMLQIDVKQNSTSGIPLMDLNGLFMTESPAETEIRLILSRRVLNSVVSKTRIDISATPINILNRFLKREGRVDLEDLELPYDEKFFLRVKNNKEYTVFSKTRSSILECKVGDTYRTLFNGDTLIISVKKINATDGEVFALSKNNAKSAVSELKKALTVQEDGKKTNIIVLSIENRYADRAAEILNSVAETYVRQNVEMRSAEAEQTLSFLEDQLPEVKDDLAKAQQALTDFRYRVGSIDLSGEAKVMLERQVELKKQIIELEQRKKSESRLYQEKHPLIDVLEKQKCALEQRLKESEEDAEEIPARQRELLALEQEVQIQNSLYSSMLNSIQQIKVVRASEIGNVRIVDYAEISPNTSKPNRKLIVICGFVVGILLCFLLIFLRYLFTNSGISSANEIENATGKSVYTKIPKMDLKKKERKQKGFVLTEKYPNNIVAEKLRTLRVALNFSFLEPGYKVLMVTGVSPGDGKTFVSMNLAFLFAQTGKKVVLIDCDLRRSHLSERKHYGVKEYITEKVPFDSIIRKHCENSYDFISTGSNSTMPTELLENKRFEELIAEARCKYDIVVIDTPPVTRVSDPLIIGRVADFSLVVLKAHAYSIDILKDVLNQLENAKIYRSALVLNLCLNRDFGSYGYGYNSYYYTQSSK